MKNESIKFRWCILELIILKLEFKFLSNAFKLAIYRIAEQVELFTILMA